jgi:hypothetical protein
MQRKTKTSVKTDTEKLSMWWTPDGQRVLQGAEAGLFREALGTVVDMVHDDNESVWQSGAPLLSVLRFEQQLPGVDGVGNDRSRGGLTGFVFMQEHAGKISQRNSSLLGSGGPVRA